MNRDEALEWCVDNINEWEGGIFHIETQRSIPNGWSVLEDSYKFAIIISKDRKSQEITEKDWLEAKKNKEKVAMNNSNAQKTSIPFYKCDSDGRMQLAGVGITKREHFAGLVLQGLVSAHDKEGIWSHDAKGAAKAAIEYADALLEELGK